MPELPEVEHIRQGLDAFLPGRRIERIVITWPGVLATHAPDTFARAVLGLTFGSVSRRGKYLILRLAPYELLIHLRMTGRILAAETIQPEWEEHPHVRAIFGLDGGARLYMRDLRKFGRISLVADAGTIVGRLGPEPLAADLSLERFSQMLSEHRRQLKPLLLDQHAIAGLGNIYVDEVLWMARLHPLRRSNTLQDLEIRLLYDALQSVLGEAVGHGGTTLRDYRGADDREGAHQNSLSAYGRTGQPCPRCSTPIVRIVVGQRGTHLCPVCQQDPLHPEVIHE